MEYGNVPFYFKPISRIVMGIMPLPVNDHARAFELLDAYRDMGGNIIDNSQIYGSERMAMMRAYYESRGEDALIRFDKGCHHWGENDAGRRVTKQAMDHDIRANLEQQGVTYSDFFVLHRDDPRIPVGDIVQWLNEHKAAGHIRAFGGSNWRHERIEAANAYADKHGLQGFSVSSSNLSLATVNEPMWWEALTVDIEGREWYRKTGFPLFAWSAAGGGWFAEIDWQTDTLKRAASPSDVERVYANEENQRRLERAREIAGKRGITPYQVALGWTLNQPLNVFALVGPDTVEQLRTNMETVDLKLSAEELRYLEFGEA